MRNSSILLVVFEIERTLLALPLAGVERVLPMIALSPLPRGPDIALGVINLAGRVIPVVDLRRRLGLAPRDYGLKGRLLVMRSRRRLLAAPVDDVHRVEEVAAAAVTSPRSVLPGLGHLAGVVALPDGVLFIEDLDAFLLLEEEAALAKGLDGTSA